MSLSVAHFTYTDPGAYRGGLSKYLNDLLHHQLRSGSASSVHVIYPGRNRLFSNEQSMNIRHTGPIVTLVELVNTNYASLGAGTRYPARDRSNPPLEDAIVGYLVANGIHVVHFHAFLGLSADLLAKISSRDIAVIYSTHDFHPLCPTVNLLDSTGAICLDTDMGRACCRCNSGAFSKTKLKIMHSLPGKILQKNIRLRNLIKSRISKRGGTLAPSGAPEDWSRQTDFQARRDGYLDALNRHVDMTIFNSHLTRRHYEMRGFSGRGMVLPVTHSHLDQPLVDYEIRIPAGKRVGFGFLGGGRREKGGALLLNAFHSISSATPPDWNLYLYGADLGNLDIPSGIAGQVIRKGYDTGDILAGLDVVVVPSVCIETFGLVVVEALLKRKLVIASGTVGAIHEFPGCQGIITFDNPASLADALLDVLRHGVSRTVRFDDKQRDMLRISRHVEQVLAVYGTALRARRASSPL